MRASLLLLLPALTGCDALSGACTGLGLSDSACNEPLQPMAGPWVATLATPNDTCGIDAAGLESGWLVCTEDLGFTLVNAAGGEHTCTVDGATFSCTSADLGGGVSATVAGTTASRSAATALVALTDGSCSIELGLSAAWRLGAAGYGDTTRTGDCPRSYDRYEGDPSAQMVDFTVENLTDVDLGLYGLSDGGAVYYTNLPAQATTTTQYGLMNWVVLATGYEADQCVHLFQISHAGQVETWRGE